MEFGNSCPLNTFAGLLLQLRRKDDSGSFLQVLFHLQTLGLSGEGFGRHKNKQTNYSSVKPVLMSTSETVTCGEV